jgi:protein disulfide-isomerase
MLTVRGRERTLNKQIRNAIVFTKARPGLTGACHYSGDQMRWARPVSPLALMKTLLSVFALLVGPVSASAEIVIGDTYQKVLLEKGKPSGRIEAGGGQILQYSDQRIKLKDGHVVSVETPAGRAAAHAPSASVPPTPVPAAAVPAPVDSPAARATAKPAVVPRAIWTTDYAAALVQAKEQNRRVFLFFTGSDWCGWCMRLKKEILSTPEFVQYAQEKLILVEIDFPQNVRQSNELKTQNAALARRYRIEGYPSVVVLNGAGKPVGQLGYQEGGPTPFVQALSRM